MVAGGSKERDWKKGVVGPKLLKSFIRLHHTIGINLLNGLSESSGEVPDGLVIPLEDGLERADVSLLPNRAQNTE